MLNYLTSFFRSKQYVTRSQLILDAKKYCYPFPCKGDVIVFDQGLAEVGGCEIGDRREAYVLQVEANDVLLQWTPNGPNTKASKWVPNYSITSLIKDCSRDRYLDLGVDKAPKIPLKTGTYIEREDDDQYYLVEIQKINGTYLISKTNESDAEIIKEDHTRDLFTFSTPEEGKLQIEPGVYATIEGDIVTLYEVVPFKGKCWHRYIDGSHLMPLEPEDAVKFQRIELDADIEPGYYLIGEEEPPVSNEESA